MSTHEVENILEQPMYSAAEASRLVSLQSVHVRRWLQGYSYIYGSEKRHQEPVVGRSDIEGSSYASFLELVDLLFVKRFIDHGISLQKLRKALDEVNAILNSTHFASEKFFTNGRNIYLEVGNKGNAILQLLSGGQWVIPEIITALADQIEFDQSSGLARRWYPLGLSGLIVLDPLVCFGRPTIVGKGLITTNVYDFFIAEGRKADAVGKWLGLSGQEVTATVKFEEKLAA